MNNNLRRENYIRFLRSINCNKNRLYRKDELLPLYQEIQSFMCEQFSYIKKTERVYEIKESIEDICGQYNIPGWKYLEEFYEMCNKFQKLISAEINGKRGEKYLKRVIDTISLEREPLYNIQLNYEDDKTEVDCLIVDDQGTIFIVESKYYENRLHIKRNGCFKDSNIGFQLLCQENIIIRILKDYGITNESIIPFVVNTSKCGTISSDYNDCYTAELSCIANQVEQFETQQVYTENEIDRIYNILKSRSNSNKYPITEFDFDRFFTLYAIILNVIDNYQKSDSNEEDVNLEKNRINSAQDASKTRVKKGLIIAGLTVITLVGGKPLLKIASKLI